MSENGLWYSSFSKVGSIWEIKGSYVEIWSNSYGGKCDWAVSKLQIHRWRISNASNSIPYSCTWENPRFACKCDTEHTEYNCITFIIWYVTILLQMFSHLLNNTPNCIRI